MNGMKIKETENLEVEMLMIILSNGGCERRLTDRRCCLYWNQFKIIETVSTREGCSVGLLLRRQRAFYRGRPLQC